MDQRPSFHQDPEKQNLQLQYPKIIPAQIDQLLQKLYIDQEVKIYEQYYKEQNIEQPLYVRCPRLQDEYHPWIGYCQECGADHDKKYIKLYRQNLYHHLPCNYKTLDCEQFSRKACEMFCRELNVFLKQMENDRNEQDFQQVVDQKIEQQSLIFDSIFNSCSGEEIYKRFVLKFSGNTKILKSLCTNGKIYPWFGYCTHCKENPPHQFFISFGGTQNAEPLPSQMKLRMINYPAFKQSFMNDLRDKLWGLKQFFVQWKFYLSTVYIQKERANALNTIQNLVNERELLSNQKDELKAKIQNLQLEQKRTESIQILQSSQPEQLDIKQADQVFKPIQKFDTFYDIEIDCESILQLTAGLGWRIKMNSDQYQIKKKVNTVIVSFYGLYNKGKTFLATKLSNKNLPLGYSVSTVGLSALYPQDLNNENAIVFLDTAGTETPICYQKSDEIVQQFLKELQTSMEDFSEVKSFEKKRRISEMKLKDRLLTEHILQKFILSESNIILIVVDQLTKEEQRMIQKIKNLYEKAEIIIVHNFSKLVSLEDVHKYIDIDIIQSFEVDEQYRIFKEVNFSGLCYVENRYDAQGSKLTDVTHVVMAHENSKAGKYYNPFCYHYLKNRILAVTKAKGFDIIENLRKMIKEHLPEIIDLPSEKFSSLKLEVTESKITTNLNSSSLKSISFDLLGDLKVFKGGLDPKYSIIMSEKELLLEAEIPGPFQPNERDVKQHEKKIMQCQDTGNRLFEWHGFRKDANDKMQYIILRGIKKDIEAEGKSDVFANTREKGEFRLIIPIDPGICVLRDDPPKFRVKNGVAELLYVLQSGQDEIDDFF